MTGPFRFLILGFATGGFVGYLPYRIVPFKKWKGSGLLGTLVGWGLIWYLPEGVAFILLTLALIALAVPASHQAEKLLESHDDPRIVIDEVAGVWIATIGIAREPAPMIAAFLFFRLFDVLKGPWGNWAARAPGGWGVMADDLLAGVIANACVRLLLPFL